ncbi:MAG: hypothetical protein HRU09_16665 [Oligoflexales bacterium]|nr:hypothetical protein [Oligoflexales bacterium]
MKTIYSRIFSWFLLISLSESLLASTDLKLSCEQLESEIILAEELVLSRTIHLSEIPDWYFGIPGLIRFGVVIEPALLETDRVFGPEFRVDLMEKTPQIVYNTALAMAYPAVMASLVPGDIAKFSYFAVTKKIIAKRLKGLKERFQAECELAEEV